MARKQLGSGASNASDATNKSYVDTRVGYGGIISDVFGYANGTINASSTLNSLVIDTAPNSNYIVVHIRVVLASATSGWVRAVTYGGSAMTELAIVDVGTNIGFVAVYGLAITPGASQHKAISISVTKAASTPVSIYGQANQLANVASVGTPNTYTGNASGTLFTINPALPGSHNSKLLVAGGVQTVYMYEAYGLTGFSNPTSEIAIMNNDTMSVVNSQFSGVLYGITAGATDAYGVIAIDLIADTSQPSTVLDWAKDAAQYSLNAVQNAVTTTGASTLTNKTISASNNTITSLPYDIVGFAQTLATRATGAGDNTLGARIARNCTFTSVTYRCITADASGNLSVELRKNGTTVSGSGATIAAASQVSGSTVTGSWSFSTGDILTVYITAVGTTPGRGLTADITGVTT